MFLDLSKNRLKGLPDEIGECTAISDLYLSENHIFELPETIGIDIKEVLVGLIFFFSF